MNEFNKQLENNLRNDINEFNTEIKYNEIRKFYFNKFDEIKFLISKFGHAQSVEDIANLDTNLKQKISQNHLLLKEINKAIENGALTKNDINND